MNNSYIEHFRIRDTSNLFDGDIIFSIDKLDLKTWDYQVYSSWFHSSTFYPLTFEDINELIIEYNKTYSEQNWDLLEVVEMLHKERDLLLMKTENDIESQWLLWVYEEWTDNLDDKLFVSLKNLRNELSEFSKKWVTILLELNELKSEYELTNFFDKKDKESLSLMNSVLKGNFSDEETKLITDALMQLISRDEEKVFSTIKWHLWMFFHSKRELLNSENYNLVNESVQKMYLVISLHLLYNILEREWVNNSIVEKLANDLNESNELKKELNLWNLSYEWTSNLHENIDEDWDYFIASSKLYWLNWKQKDTLKILIKNAYDEQQIENIKERIRSISKWSKIDEMKIVTKSLWIMRIYVEFSFDQLKFWAFLNYSSLSNEWTIQYELSLEWHRKVKWEEQIKLLKWKWDKWILSKMFWFMKKNESDWKLTGNEYVLKYNGYKNNTVSSNWAQRNKMFNQLSEKLLKSLEDWENMYFILRDNCAIYENKQEIRIWHICFEKEESDQWFHVIQLNWNETLDISLNFNWNVFEKEFYNEIKENLMNKFITHFRNTIYRKMILKHIEDSYETIEKEYKFSKTWYDQLMWISTTWEFDEVFQKAQLILQKAEQIKQLDREIRSLSWK